MLFSWAMSSSYPGQNSLQASGTEMYQLQTCENNSLLNEAILPCLELRGFFLSLSWIREIEWAEWQLQLKCGSDNYCVVCEWLAGKIQVFPERLYFVCFEDRNTKSLSRKVCFPFQVFIKKKKKSIINIILTPRNQLRTIVSLCLVLDRHKEVSVNN